MPQVIIDGKPYDFEGQHKLLQFCLDSGVDVPYFCYHPAMSIPTNCRMCLVDVGYEVRNRETGEVEREADGSPKIMWGRKPNTSCNTDLAPGMHVRTQASSPSIKKAQQGVLEFMLVNHPLDCPICDQAGECPLQINTYKFGPEGSRYELEKVHKPKRIELGPRVTLDAERCINCTRCVRFTEEISETNQLTIMARGEKNYPAAAPGQVFDDAYSMNTIDICPVGALTSSAFRFKARVWEMNYSPSICTGCSKGCSTDVWVRDNEVLRLTPRHNPAVNDYWMCDAGRLDIQKYNQHRVSGTKIKGDIPVPFEYALQDAAALLKQHKGQTLWVASPHASLETLYALRKLAGNLGVQAADIVYAVPRDEAFADSLLKQADRSPNAASCVLLGFSEVTLEDLQAKAQAAELLYVCEDEAVANAFAGLYGSKAAIVQARRYFEGHANVDVLLPATESIEMFGTYINVDNIAQLSYMGKQIKQMSPDMWMSMPKSRLDAAGVAIDNWRHPEHIQDALPGWILLGQMHHLLEYAFAFKNHKEIFQQLKSEFAEVLEGVEIRKRARKEIFKISQLEFATGR